MFGLLYDHCVFTKLQTAGTGGITAASGNIALPKTLFLRNVSEPIGIAGLNILSAGHLRVPNISSGRELFPNGVLGPEENMKDLHEAQRLR